MYKAVLFDFDGTVCDTIQCVMTCMEKSAQDLGVEIPLDKGRAMIGRPLSVIGEELIGPGWGQPFMDRFLQFYPDCCRGNIRFYPGVREAIVELREHGLKICIVSSKSRAFLIDNLKQIGGYELVDEIVPLEEHEKPKPHPAPVLRALQKLNAKPDEVIMVGDTHFDMECAQGAGVATVGVTWGGGTEESVRSANPEHIARNGKELRKILKKHIIPNAEQPPKSDADCYY